MEKTQIGENAGLSGVHLAKKEVCLSKDCRQKLIWTQLMC